MRRELDVLPSKPDSPDFYILDTKAHITISGAMTSLPALIGQVSNELRRSAPEWLALWAANSQFGTGSPPCFHKRGTREYLDNLVQVLGIIKDGIALGKLPPRLQYAS
jgi:hypothetical protein